MGDFYTVLNSRRSIREFELRPIEAETIVKLLTAATAAPSAHNRQPWRFSVLQKLQDKEALAGAMGARLKAERTADGDDPALIEADVNRSRARITGAAAVILVCVTLEDMDHYSDQKRSAAERQMAVQSVAMASQNLLLSAQAEGIGACWMCAPLFAAEEVLDSLELPSTWLPQGLIILGHPAEPGRPRSRKPLEEVATFF
jgi:F420 biosynthesis protein FbiB-like protein